MDPAESRESELARSEAMLRRAEKAARIGCWRLELASRKMIGSEGALELFGVVEPELLYDSVRSIPLPEFRPALDAALADLVAGRAPYDVVFKIRRPADGAVLVIHSTAEYDAASGSVFGVIQDVTRQAEAEAALAEDEARYHALFRDSGSVMLLMDPRDGRIVEANDAAASFYGWSREELEAKRIQEINTLPPEAVEAEIRAVAERRKAFFEFRHRLADGSVRDVEVHSTPVSIGGRQLLYSVVHDVSDARRARAESERLLREKELLLREVHHRIKNNMESVAGLLSLQCDATCDPVTKGALVDAQSRVIGMAAIYDKLYRSSDFRTIEARSYFEELLADIKSIYAAGRPIELGLEVQDLLFDAKVLVPLAIIVNELFINALKYAFPGGRAGSVRLSLKRLDGGLVEAKVEDDGIGLGAAAPPREEGRGGFGLVLVESLAEQLGSRIERPRGPGTRFRLAFRA